jgi:hypothetical protein
MRHFSISLRMFAWAIHDLAQALRMVASAERHIEEGRRVRAELRANSGRGRW